GPRPPGILSRSRGPPPTGGGAPGRRRRSRPGISRLEAGKRALPATALAACAPRGGGAPPARSADSLSADGVRRHAVSPPLRAGVRGFGRPAVPGRSAVSGLPAGQRDAVRLGDALRSGRRRPWRFVADDDA